MYKVKARYVFGKRDKEGRYIAGYREYRDMFTKPQVQKVKKFIQSLEKKQWQVFFIRLLWKFTLFRHVWH